MSRQQTLVPVILSGGAGSRLWPLSRDLHPKPFIDLPDGETLVQKTYARALALDPVSRIVTVTNKELYFLSESELAKVRTQGIDSSYIIEPVGRDTAAAIAAATIHVAEVEGPDAVLLVMPADHMISNQNAFSATVDRAVDLAAEGRIVTIGITPDRPETGFGYIEVDNGKVRRFVEKPDAASAAEFVGSGRFFWNSGIFCFQAKTMLEALGKYCAETITHVHEALQRSDRITENEIVRILLDDDSYQKIAPVSIDKSVIEKTENLGFVPAGFDWSDIGSWAAFSQLTPADADGNRIDGDGYAFKTTGSYIRSGSRFVYLVGVDDLVVVDTPDALFVGNRNQAQDMKQAIAEMPADKKPLVNAHRKVHRPWGSYTVIEEGPRYKIKRIAVNPGAKLSLQKHFHRSEHWIVISGSAQVTKGEAIFVLTENQSTYIEIGEVHSLENPGKVPLVIVEVQSGEYLGEDDIVRFEDKYGRV